MAEVCWYGRWLCCKIKTYQTQNPQRAKHVSSMALVECCNTYWKYTSGVYQTCANYKLHTTHYFHVVLLKSGAYNSGNSFPCPVFFVWLDQISLQYYGNDCVLICLTFGRRQTGWSKYRWWLKMMVIEKMTVIIVRVMMKAITDCGGRWEEKQLLTVLSEPSLSWSKADLKPMDKPSAGGSKLKAPHNYTWERE